MRSSSPHPSLDKLVAEVAQLRVDIEDMNSEDHNGNKGPAPSSGDAPSGAGLCALLKVCTWNSQGFS